MHEHNATPPPIFDPETGEEVSREAFVGQRELAAELGTSPERIGKILDELGFRQGPSNLREVTAKATAEAVGRMVVMETAEGQRTHPRWNKKKILPVLEDAVRGPHVASNRLDHRFRQLQQQMLELEKELRRQRLI